MADQTTAAAETKEDFGEGKGASVTRWLAEIKAYETTFKTWTERSGKIIKRYRDERESEQDKSVRFNILWSNVQTLQPALYSQQPSPDVRRRYKDRDPVGRAAAEILERCLSYGLDSYDFSATAKAARDDYLLTARGVAWVRYIPHYGEETTDRTYLQTVEPKEGEEGEATYSDDDGKPVAEPQFDDEGKAYTEGEPYRPVVNEEAVCDHIAWTDFGHTPAPKWDKVTAVWKRELLTRDQFVARFGKEKGKAVALQKKLVGVTDEAAQAFGDAFKRGECYEIWDRTSQKVIWISPGYTEGPLDEQADPLRLKNFFPCGRPLYGTMTTDTLVPVPDYIQYQSQALELDILTQRISLLTEALKVAGAYNSEVADLERLVKGTENTMVPVDNWGMFSEKGGLKGQMDFLPIKEIAEVALSLVQARERIKADLYEITGISDIVRGQASGPKATATEQRIKGQWASIRLQDRQDEMARFVRDNIRIKAEIIAEHFEPETLAEMSGWLQSPEAGQIDRRHQMVEGQRQQAMMAMQQAQMQQAQQPMPGQPPAPPAQMPPMPEPVPSAREIFDQAVQLLRDDKLRTFRVDIETDSTIAADDQAEKQTRVEFLNAVSGFLQQALPAAQLEPGLKPLLSEMLLFGVRGFKTGRHLEAVMEETLEGMANAPPQQQAPVEGQAQGNPAADAEKAALEREKLALQREEAGHRHAMEQAKFRADEADRQRKHEIEMANVQIKAVDVEGGQAIERERMAVDVAIHQDQQAVAQAATPVV